MKFYIFLLKEFQGFLNEKHLNKLFPLMNWNKYVDTEDFIELQIEIEDEVTKSEFHFGLIADEC